MSNARTQTLHSRGERVGDRGWEMRSGDLASWMQNADILENLQCVQGGTPYPNGIEGNQAQRHPRAGSTLYMSPRYTLQTFWP